MIGIWVAALSLVALAVGLAGMTMRLDRREPPPRWYVNDIHDTSFQFRGDQVELQTIGAGDSRAVEVRWRGESTRLPVTGLEDERLPKLTAHKEWLRVLQMARDKEGLSVQEAIEAREGMYRLVIVGKDQPDDPLRELARAQRRDQTVFTFLLFTEDGGLERSQARFDELEQGTWRFAAAMELVSARPNMIDDGFSSLGWTWASARIGVLGLVIGILLIGSSYVRRESFEGDIAEDAGQS